MIGFLEKLKELHYIDGYDICASVKEAIDIDFMEITPFKQIGVGNYYFNVYQSSPGMQPRSISGDMGIAGFTSFELQVGSNEMYTIYLVGSTFTTPSLQPVIVTNV